MVDDLSFYHPQRLAWWSLSEPELHNVAEEPMNPLFLVPIMGVFLADWIQGYTSIPLVAEVFMFPI